MGYSFEIAVFHLLTLAEAKYTLATAQHNIYDATTEQHFYDLPKICHIYPCYYPIHRYS